MVKISLNILNMSEENNIINSGYDEIFHPILLKKFPVKKSKIQKSIYNHFFFLDNWLTPKRKTSI